MSTEKRLEIHSTRNTPSLNGLSNVVVDVSWSRVVAKILGEGANAKTYTSRYPGITKVSAPDPQNFINFDNVTDDHLKEWVSQLVDFDPIDAKIELQIQKTADAPLTVPRNPA